MKQVIVTGCPRSGSRRLHAAFGQVKAPAAHERDSDITISCYLAVDGEDYANNHEPYWNRVVDEIWHMTRDPMTCVPSMVARMPSHFWAWQQGYTGLHPTMFRSRLEFASHFWVRWNKEAEERDPVWTFRSEEMEENWPLMWERLENPVPDFDKRGENYSGRGRDDASSYRQGLTWEMVEGWSPTLHYDMAELAERYGYTCPR